MLEAAKFALTKDAGCLTTGFNITEFTSKPRAARPKVAGTAAVVVVPGVVDAAEERAAVARAKAVEEAAQHLPRPP